MDPYPRMPVTCDPPSATYHSVLSSWHCCGPAPAAILGNTSHLSQRVEKLSGATCSFHILQSYCSNKAISAYVLLSCSVFKYIRSLKHCKIQARSPNFFCLFVCSISAYVCSVCNRAFRAIYAYVCSVCNWACEQFLLMFAQLQAKEIGRSCSYFTKLETSNILENRTTEQT